MLLQLILTGGLLKRQNGQTLTFRWIGSDLLLRFLELVIAIKNLSDKTGNLTREVGHFFTSGLGLFNYCTQLSDAADSALDHGKSSYRVNLLLTELGRLPV